MKKTRDGRISAAMDGIGADLIQEAGSYSCNNTGKRKGKRAIIIAAAAALLAAVGLGAFFIAKNADEGSLSAPEGIILTGSAFVSDGTAELPEGLGNMVVTADCTAANIVPAAGSFTITTEGATDKETLVQYLSVSPEIPVNVEQLSDNKFTLSAAAGSFAPGSIVKIMLGDPENPAVSYAFQTEAGMNVKSVLPADLSTGAPVDTGIEICFSDSLSKKAKFGTYISVRKEGEKASLKGEFMLYPDGRTLAFIPKNDLEYNTVYVVNIEEGLESISGKALSEGMTVRFRTASSETSAYENGYINLSLGSNGAELQDIISPDVTSELSVRVYGSDLTNTLITVKAWKYTTFAAAAEAIKEHEAVPGSNTRGEASLYSTDGLSEVYSKSHTLELSRSKDYACSTETLGTLPEGIYLVRVTAERRDDTQKKLSTSAECFIQVTPLRSFTASSDGKLLVWVTDDTGIPEKGADIYAYAYTRADGWNSTGASPFVKISGKTSADGTCMLETDTANAAIVCVSSGEHGLLIAACSKSSGGEYYMKYLYTDREVYFTDDTVNFSGYIIPSYSGTEIPEILYLKSGYTDVMTPVKVDADGSFSGSYAIEDMSEGGFYISLCNAGGEALVSKYIRITEAEKPVITASIEFDRPVYSYGDTVTVTLTCSFFDGTPAPDFRFTFTSDPFGIGNGDDSATYKTDANGEIVFRIKTGYVKAYSTDPVYISVSAMLDGMETQTLTLSESVLYFHSDRVFGIEYGSDYRTLTLNKRDISVIKSADDLNSSVFPENTVGAAASGSVSYKLVKHTVTEHENTGYSAYTKRKYSYKTYTCSDETVDSGTLIFRDGRIELPLKEVSGFRGTYWYELSYNDGRQTFSYSVNAVKYSRNICSATDSCYSLELNADAYIPGEKITASLTNNGGEVDNVLYFLAADGLSVISEGSSAELTYDGAMIPGAYLFGITMNPENGSFIWRQSSVYYDIARAGNLNVEITPDKTVYRPGDKASVTVKVTDADGKPVSGVSVVLSIADEACFALGEQSADTSGIFSSNGMRASNYSSYYRIFIKESYSRAALGGGEPKQISLNNRFTVCGWNSDDSEDLADGIYCKTEALEGTSADSAGSADTGNTVNIREDFADNPLFVTVKTGKYGAASAELEIPDNITSWRITCCAFSGSSAKELSTGCAVSDVVCTQDFFIQPNCCTQYVAGDDISASARSYGTEATGKVSYTAYLYSEAGELIATKKASAEPTAHAWFNFGRLDPGSYSIVFQGSCGKSADAVRSEFTVLASASFTDVRRVLERSEITSLTPVMYPLTLTFYRTGSSYSLYNRITDLLKAGNSSGRADMLFARIVALEASEKLYGTSAEESIGNLKALLAGYGSDYVSFLTYSEDDPELTAQMLAVDPSVFGAERRSLIVTACYSAISEKVQPDEVTLCANLLSLAALSEPVLDRLYSVAAVAGSYPAEARLYLAAAFAAIGDYSAASDIWTAVKDELGVYNSEYGTLYLKAEALQTQVRLTSLAMLTCARISRTDAAAMAEYLAGNHSEEQSSETAMAAYLKFFMPTGEDTSVQTLSYRICGGEEKTVTLNGRKRFTLMLTKSEYAGLEILSMDNGITVYASYYGTVEEAKEGKAASDRLSIKKEIVPVGNGRFNVVLTVSGTSTRVYEAFSLRDWIPSGARFCSGGYTNDDNSTVRCIACIYNISGQKMGGYLSVHNRLYNYDSGGFVTDCPEYGFEVTLTYQIRGAVAGSFTAEPAIIMTYATDIYALSDTFTVKIPDSTASEWKIVKIR